MSYQKQPEPTPDIVLQQMATTFKERRQQYGENYLDFGPSMAKMFPNGFTIRSADDWVMAGLFIQMASKMTRLAQNMQGGGHLDSVHDLAVYSAMMESFMRKRDAEATEGFVWSR